MALTTKRITRLIRPGKPLSGRHHDGHGLYLQVRPEGNASWLLRYERIGKERMLGLGPLHVVGLKEARERARKARLQLLDDIDPVSAKQAARRAATEAAAKTLTFRAATDLYFTQHEMKWRSRKHPQQFRNTLQNYAHPVIGALSVAEIDTTLVLRVLERENLWTTKNATAQRVRGRIEAVLDWATVRGFRQGDNPARWKGHLAEVLPAPGAIAKVEHHAAMAYAAVPEFLQQLRERDGVAPRALEFLILTAARTGEALGAQWREIDLKEKVWTVPAGRMKGGREHRIPLSRAAVELLEHLPRLRGNHFVFVGGNGSGRLSDVMLSRLLRRMGRDDVTVHGFRSTFRDWAAERTNFQNHIVEMALAHTVGSKVEAAYRRGDLLDQRRRLMAQWADYCGSVPEAASGKVVAIGYGKSAVR